MSNINISIVNLLQSLFNTIINTIVYVLYAILTHPLIKKAVADAIVLGLTAFVRDPHLDDHLDILNETLSRRAEERARNMGKDFPKVVNHFVKGMFVKDDVQVDAEKLTANENQVDKASPKAAKKKYLSWFDKASNESPVETANTDLTRLESAPAALGDNGGSVASTLLPSSDAKNKEQTQPEPTKNFMQNLFGKGSKDEKEHNNNSNDSPRISDSNDEVIKQGPDNTLDSTIDDTTTQQATNVNDSTAASSPKPSTGAFSSMFQNIIGDKRATQQKLEPTAEKTVPNNETVVDTKQENKNLLALPIEESENNQTNTTHQNEDKSNETVPGPFVSIFQGLLSNATNKEDTLQESKNDLATNDASAEQSRMSPSNQEHSSFVKEAKRLDDSLNTIAAIAQERKEKASNAKDAHYNAELVANETQQVIDRNNLQTNEEPADITLAPINSLIGNSSGLDELPSSVEKIDVEEQPSTIAAVSEQEQATDSDPFVTEQARDHDIMLDKKNTTPQTPLADLTPWKMMQAVNVPSAMKTDSVLHSPFFTA